MPARNIIRIDEAQSYYHIYARGVDKRSVFLDYQDKDYFTSLFKRYLSKQPQTNANGRVYPNYSHQLELLAYCLMDNHFHLLVYQEDLHSISKLMSSLMTSYSRYFNLRYGRTGALFETKYRAALISNDSYLLHISRYIHLNPDQWNTYEYSSIRYYLYGERSEWLSPGKIKQLFADTQNYLAFLSDYQGHRRMLQVMKASLADTI